MTTTHPPLHQFLDACDCGAKAREMAMMASHHLGYALFIMRHVRRAKALGVPILRAEFSHDLAVKHIREWHKWRLDFHQMLRGNRSHVGFLDGYRSVGR